MPSSDHEQVTPLALAAIHPTTNDEEDPSTKPRRRLLRRRCILCCASCTTVLVLIAIIIVILAFTVFKVKEPKMTMNSMTIQGLSAIASSSTASAFNVTVVADISVKNPNAASFKFGSTTTYVYYKEGLVGMAYGPPGNARAHKTFRANMTVDVLGDQLVGDVDLMADVIQGVVGMKSSTMVGGRVKILGIFKHHVDVMMNCSMSIAVLNQSILDQNCNHRVWL